MNIFVALILIAFAAWTYVERDTPAAVVIFITGLLILYLS